MPRHVTIKVDHHTHLPGELMPPLGDNGLVVFAHGSGSSRHSPRNQYVAGVLNDAGLGTLLFDLLTPEEEPVDRYYRSLRFDIDLLGQRLTGTVDWLGRQPTFRDWPIGLFGASTGAAAALLTAADRARRVRAVVSRGGRADLAKAALPMVQAPTLLIVGGRDDQVLALNREAATAMRAPHHLAVVPDASHLFEEPGALQQVADLARNWFQQHLLAQDEAA
jgi:dienelactone hydrolase